MSENLCKNPWNWRLILPKSEKYHPEFSKNRLYFKVFGAIFNHFKNNSQTPVREYFSTFVGIYTWFGYFFSLELQIVCSNIYWSINTLWIANDLKFWLQKRKRYPWKGFYILWSKFWARVNFPHCSTLNEYFIRKVRGSFIVNEHNFRSWSIKLEQVLKCYQNFSLTT